MNSTPVADPGERQFVVFSDDWGIHPSSSQHIFKHIAGPRRVSWINTVGMRRPHLVMTDIAKARRKLGAMFSRPAEDRVQGTPSGLNVYQPFMVPFNDISMVRRLNAASVTRTLRSIEKKLEGIAPIVLTTVPNACDYVDKIQGATIVYYCVDDFSEWPGLDKDLVLDMEASLIEKADVFIATSSNLFNHLSKSGKPTYLLPHGVDIQLFSSDATAEHEVLQGIPAPRAGYFGLFDDRSDQELIFRLATDNPDISFVIAGRVETSVKRLDDLPNVHFVGLIDYKKLPAFVRGVDVLFLPYLVDALSESLSPLKLKEYLVTGRPVISTPITAATEMSDMMAIAKTAQDWNRYLREGIEADWRAVRDRMVTRLATESWDAKAEQLLKICYGTATSNHDSYGGNAAWES